MNSLTPRLFAAALIGVAFSPVSQAQTATAPGETKPDVATLSAINSGRTPPAYPVPYAPAKIEEITEVLGRVHGYLAAVTPAKLVDRTTQVEITDFSKPLTNAVPARRSAAIGCKKTPKL